ncbi:hypothetical protein ACFQH6_14705 [Halobacteriaceae archaeon GCM10025711]
MPTCHNCGNADRFDLLVDLAVRHGPDGFTDPDWSLALRCVDCSSTDVAGDPAALLVAYDSG